MDGKIHEKNKQQICNKMKEILMEKHAIVKEIGIEEYHKRYPSTPVAELSDKMLEKILKIRKIMAHKRKCLNCLKEQMSLKVHY